MRIVDKASLLRALVLLGALLALGGCNRGRVEELETHVNDLSSQLAESQARVQQLEEQIENSRDAVAQVESDMETLKSASASLSDTANRLDSESWRDVVPDIASGSNDVDSAADELDSSIGHAQSELEDQ